VAVSVGFQIYACSHMSFDEFNKQLLLDVFKTFGINKTATHPTGD
jgi:hypothetical protein